MRSHRSTLDLTRVKMTKWGIRQSPLHNAPKYCLHALKMTTLKRVRAAKPCETRQHGGQIDHMTSSVDHSAENCPAGGWQGTGRELAGNRQVTGRELAGNWQGPDKQSMKSKASFSFFEPIVKYPLTNTLKRQKQVHFVINAEKQLQGVAQT